MIVNPSVGVTTVPSAWIDDAAVLALRVNIRHERILSEVLAMRIC